MCVTVVINRGEKEIGTPREFREHFGFDAPLEPYYKEVVPDACLCQVDIEKAFKDNNIPYKFDYMDYYVGDLENVIVD